MNPLDYNPLSEFVNSRQKFLKQTHLKKNKNPVQACKSTL